MKHKNIIFIFACVLALCLVVPIQLVSNVEYWTIIVSPIFAIPLAYWIYDILLKKGWLKLKEF